LKINVGLAQQAENILRSDFETKLTEIFGYGVWKRRKRKRKIKRRGRKKSRTKKKEERKQK
jgi:hypothetical protein